MGMRGTVLLGLLALAAALLSGCHGAPGPGRYGGFDGYWTPPAVQPPARGPRLPPVRKRFFMMRGLGRKNTKDIRP